MIYFAIGLTMGITIGVLFAVSYCLMRLVPRLTAALVLKLFDDDLIDFCRDGEDEEEPESPIRHVSDLITDHTLINWHGTEQ